MSGQGIDLIVVGNMNTDIVALGVDRLLSAGELTHSGRLLIGPGGKSCNIARMAAALMGPGKVAMVGKTARDPYGLWKVPVDALEAAGVDTGFVKVEDFDTAGVYPGIALIPVNGRGENQIYSVPGIGESFGPRDIDDASSLFGTACGARMLALTLGPPLQTVIHAVRKACTCGMRVVLDPGDVNERGDYSELLGLGISVLAPNEHEARILTGVEISDMRTAQKAAGILYGRGVDNVVLTHGGNGAYVFAAGEGKHIPVPRITAGDIKDETGCGDQVTAVLCAELLRGKNLWEAGAAAVLAGTMQFHRPGIQPVTGEEMETASRREDGS